MMTKPLIQVICKGEEKRFSCQEFSSMALTRMKEIAENYLGQDMKQGVVSIPVYVNVNLAMMPVLLLVLMLSSISSTILVLSLLLLDINAVSEGKLNIMMFVLGFNVSILSIMKMAFS